tara:strand:- start:323 stop:475 length:153 start_codon:yes stop_codon:yes gene_type:complete
VEEAEEIISEAEAAEDFINLLLLIQFQVLVQLLQSELEAAREVALAQHLL